VEFGGELGELNKGLGENQTRPHCDARVVEQQEVTTQDSQVVSPNCFTFIPTTIISFILSACLF
jgi:hypothetical protein